MDYKNSEMKIDQLVSYLNEDKINLSPAFQRGHVWKIGVRKKLLQNIIAKKPIPAVFLYKEATGAKYSYNILDGKQRIESIILYIGDSRKDVKIPAWKAYFLKAGTQRKQASFAYDPKDPQTSFANLDDAVVRDFRESSIPTIEISLDEKADLTEIISLFIDINQQGVPVSRFNIVKALCLDSKLLATMFSLIAQKRQIGKESLPKMIDNDITRVLKKLRDVQAVTDPNFKVDKMWEHLLELYMFCNTGHHRTPTDIVKGFINKKIFNEVTVDKKTIKSAKNAFKVPNSVNRQVTVVSPLFTDYTYFYSIATALMKENFLTYNNRVDIEAKLVRLANALAEPRRAQLSSVKHLVTQAKLHTTNVSNREEREKMIIELLNGPATSIAKK